MSYLTRPPAPKTQVADLVDDLKPGSLKDEMKGESLILIKKLTKNIYKEKI